MSSDVVVVVSKSRDLPELKDGVVLADDYLSTGGAGVGSRPTVINLCRSFRYRSKGYYVSLVADARGQKVLPSIETLEEVSDPFGVYRVLREAGIPTLEVAEMKSWRPGKAEEVEETVLVFQGRCPDRRFRKQAQAIFRAWPAPVLRVRLVFRTEQWWVASVEPVPLKKLNAEQRQQLVDVLTQPGKTAIGPSTQAEIKRASIAVLYDPADPFSPSTADTIAHLEKLAASENVYLHRIGLDEIDRLPEYDALLIRTLTGVREPSFQFALRAEMLDMPVIDDPQSIIRCSNKVFLEELLRREAIPTPRTMIVTARTPWQEVAALGSPLVVKLPDGSFSAAVHKVEDPEEYAAVTAEIFRRSPLLIAQEFLQTDFDWRITLLDGRLLFAARYHMAEGHWQIRSEVEGEANYGLVEAVKREDAPREVVELARRAAALIGHGLYGVDIKETPDGPVVIEINDNPNIDLGEEDRADGDQVYLDLLAYFLRRVEVPPSSRAAQRRLNGPRRPRKDFRAFAVAGIELEYPIVDANLDPVHLAEDFLRAMAGRPTSDVQLGPVGFSNEIADHVLEIKTVDPIRSLARAEQLLFDGVRHATDILQSRFDARLLPTAMHPWFNPAEGRLWTRSNQRIYNAYASIFDVRTHGWMNVQAAHLNLPMGTEAEAVALHNAAALLIPYLPAIAASSPVHDGRIQETADSRLAWIQKHQARVPASQGDLVPEYIGSLGEYRREILQPMYREISGFPEGSQIKHDFLNARSAVFKFGRRALELRVIDVQECVRMDIAIAVFARAVLRYYSRRLQEGRLKLPDRAFLIDDFNACVAGGSAALVFAPAGDRSSANEPRPVREHLTHLLEIARSNIRGDEAPLLDLVERRISRGSLAEQIRRAIGDREEGTESFDRRLREVYRKLSECLQNNRPWEEMELE